MPAGPNGGFGYIEPDRVSVFSCCGASAVKGFNFFDEKAFLADYNWWLTYFPWHTGIGIVAIHQKVALAGMKTIKATLISRIKNNDIKEGNLFVFQIHKPSKAYGPVVGQDTFEPAALQRFDIERAFT